MFFIQKQRFFECFFQRFKTMKTGKFCKNTEFFGEKTWNL